MTKAGFFRIRYLLFPNPNNAHSFFLKYSLHVLNFIKKSLENCIVSTGTLVTEIFGSGSFFRRIPLWSLMDCRIQIREYFLVFRVSLSSLNTFSRARPRPFSEKQSYGAVPVFTAVLCSCLTYFLADQSGTRFLVCNLKPTKIDCFQVTNDGATILRAVGVDNPAAKVLVEMSRVQVR
jgi:hypothetical protein